MMMLPEKKSSAALIVAKIKPGKSDEVKEEVMPGEAQDDYSLAMEDAAKKVIDAVSKKDAKMLVMHLQDLVDMMGSKESECEKED